MVSLLLLMIWPPSPIPTILLEVDVEDDDCFRSSCEDVNEAAVAVAAEAVEALCNLANLPEAARLRPGLMA